MSIILKNVQVVDVVNSRVMDKTNIIIEGDTITGLSENDTIVKSKQYEVVDFNGCFALPGLIDLHTHLIWSAGPDPVRVVEEEGIQLSLLRAAENARKTLEAGITCVRDVGSNENGTIALARAVEKGYIAGPRIVSCGCTIIMTGGHDPFWGEQADGPAELTKAVRRQVYHGAGVIKISATGGVYGRQHGEDVGTAELNGEEIKAVCDEAHRFGLKVAAHAISDEGIWNCIKGGVDTIEHGHFLTLAAMEEMKKRNICWVPTLYVYKQIASGIELPPYAVKKAQSIVDIHRQAFQNGLHSGVAIACGSDSGSPNTPHGSLLNELEYMVDYGCKPLEALQSATIVAARALGMEKSLGSLEVGKKADIIVLSKNPLENIQSLKELRMVMKGGEII